MWGYEPELVLCGVPEGGTASPGVTGLAYGPGIWQLGSHISPALFAFFRIQKRAFLFFSALFRACKGSVSLRLAWTAERVLQEPVLLSKQLLELLYLWLFNWWALLSSLVSLQELSVFQNWSS